MSVTQIIISKQHVLQEINQWHHLNSTTSNGMKPSVNTT